MLINKNILGIFIFILLLFVFLIGGAHIIKAQTTFTPSVGIGDSNFQAGSGVEITGLSIADYIIAVYKWSIRVIAILAVIVIMVAGFRWVSAAGNASVIGQAKNQMIDAFIGLILVIGANLLLYFINPALVRFNDLSITHIKKVSLDNYDFPIEQAIMPNIWDESEKQPNIKASACGIQAVDQEDGRTYLGVKCSSAGVPGASIRKPCVLQFSLTSQDYQDDINKKADIAEYLADIYYLGKDSGYNVESGCISRGSVFKYMIPIYGLIEAATTTYGKVSLPFRDDPTVMYDFALDPSTNCGVKKGEGDIIKNKIGMKVGIKCPNSNSTCVFALVNVTDDKINKTAVKFYSFCKPDSGMPMCEPSERRVNCERYTNCKVSGCTNEIDASGKSICCQQAVDRAVLRNF
ncbi:MAG: pilin [Patescibacteria group bacterium]|nr:pilin [Patescibacteria group bacterium]MDD5121621.1 pilin [Patescibacteria group bacterium]MDD5221936.1 pilin [Patescibacteria group bacterium]MDD5396215.1 pilin [Patescibacteria group bacterium]